MDIKDKIKLHNLCVSIQENKECFKHFKTFATNLHSFKLNDEIHYVHPFIEYYITKSTSCMDYTKADSDEHYPGLGRYVFYNDIMHTNQYDKLLKELYVRIISRVRKNCSLRSFTQICTEIYETMGSYNVRLQASELHGEVKQWYAYDMPQYLFNHVETLLEQKKYKESTKANVRKAYEKMYKNVNSIKYIQSFMVKRLVMRLLTEIDERYFTYKTMRWESNTTTKGYIDRKMDKQWVGKPSELHIPYNGVERLSRWGSDSLIKNISTSEVGQPYENLIKDFNAYVEPSMQDDRNFTITNDGIMTFTPAGKPTIVNSEGSYWLNHRKDLANRIPIKVHKGIRKMFKHVKFTDKWIEDIGNHIKSLYTFEGSFKIVSGEDIRKYYHEDWYSTDVPTGSLSGSCMKHDNCQDFFDMYVNTPEVKMLVAFKNEDSQYIIGRALLWNKVQCHTYDEEIKCMDRIYGNQVTINAFKRWGTNNGYHVKTEQTYDNSKFTSPTGTIVEKLTVHVTNVGSQVPYMDSFRFTDDMGCSDMILSTFDGCDTLDSTSGGNDDYVETVDGSRYHEDDCRYVEYGDSEHGWYHYDDTVYVEDGYDMFYDDAVEVDGYWYNPNGNEVVWSEYDEEYISNNSAVQLNCGSWVDEANAVTCEIDDHYIHVNDSHEIRDYTVHVDYDEDYVVEHFNLEEE